MLVLYYYAQVINHSEVYETQVQPTLADIVAEYLIVQAGGGTAGVVHTASHT